METHNRIICNCKRVSVADIESALKNHERFESVTEEFEYAQSVTACSTGCGGCKERILDVIADMMNGKKIV